MEAKAKIIMFFANWQKDLFMQHIEMNTFDILQIEKIELEMQRYNPFDRNHNLSNLLFLKAKEPTYYCHPNF